MILERGRHTLHDIYINGHSSVLDFSFSKILIGTERNNENASHNLHNLFIILNKTDLPIYMYKQIKLYNTMVAHQWIQGGRIWRHSPLLLRTYDLTLNIKHSKLIRTMNKKHVFILLKIFKKQYTCTSFQKYLRERNYPGLKNDGRGIICV